MKARKLQEKIKGEVGVRPTLSQLAELLERKQLKGSDEIEISDAEFHELCGKAANINARPNPAPEPDPPAVKDEKETKKRKWIVTIALSYGIDLALAKRIAGLAADAPDKTLVVTDDFDTAFGEYQVSQESQAAPHGTTLDPNVKAKLLVIIKRDREMSKSNYGIKGEGIDLEPSGDIRLKYPDPMDDLLEDVDRFYLDKDQRRRKIKGTNFISITRQQAEQYDERRYPWRSREYWGMVERLLGQLLINAPNCKECGEPILSGFQVEARDVLTGKVKLDSLRPPTLHDACFGIAHVLRDLKLKLKDKDADDPETIALRTAAYVDAVKNAQVWLRERHKIEVSKEELTDAFKKILKRSKQKSGSGEAS